MTSRRFLLLLLAAISTGCSAEPRRRITHTGDRAKSSSNISAEAHSDFDDGREMLFNLYRFDSEQGGARCVLSFNQWLEKQTDDDWRADPMVLDLPDVYRKTTAISNLRELSIDDEDVDYMETCIWMRDIVRWIDQTELDAHLEQWIAEHPAIQSKRDLRLAAKLFDWTIRNIQLQPFEQPNAELSIQPGSQQTVRWTTLLGMGDGITRARVFLRLCQQAEIVGVMLAVKNSQGSLASWAPATLIDGKLYLFDTQLGLPIPLPGDVGIATLSEAREDPQVLAQLTLSAKYKYPIAHEKLSDITALVDADPPALSHRMELIQNRLTGKHRLTLTVRPSRVREQLADNDVRTLLWDLAYHVMRYQSLERLRVKRDPRFAALKSRQEALFVGTDQLITGRKLHLHGQFTKDGDQDGAKQAYMKVRFADALVDRLPTDRQIQQQFGFVKTSDIRDDEWEMYMRGMQVKLREEKMHVSFWIGLIHFEEGNYESASQWFSKRVLEENEGSMWTPSARYNLARCYERMGRIADARAIYLSDTSTQQHGNLIRARLLKSEE